MDFISSLKAKARRIIELSNELGERAHTWNKNIQAPVGGYTDRAGFVISDSIELFADVYVSDDGAESLLRARLALSPSNEVGQSLFTIITLDFNTMAPRAGAIIADADNLSAQSLISLLEEPGTTPKLIHVSLESGKDDTDNVVGKRYEYSDKEINDLNPTEQAKFLSLLDQAFDHIVSKKDN